MPKGTKGIVVSISPVEFDNTKLLTSETVALMLTASIILTGIGILCFPLMLPAICFAHAAYSECKKDSRIKGKKWAVVLLTVGYLYTFLLIVLIGCLIIYQ